MKSQHYTESNFDESYTKQGKRYRYWRAWGNFRAILGILHRRAELRQLIKWATRKRLTKPLRLYERRLQEEEDRLFQYRRRARHLLIWAQIVRWIGALIAPSPRYHRKGAAAKYRNPNPRKKKRHSEKVDTRLYIKHIYDRNHKNYMPKIKYWVDKRDALAEAGQSAAANAAQHNAVIYADKLYARGYFVDPHPHNLLALFRLCWQRDIMGKIVDADGMISPANARRFLTMLLTYEPSYRMRCWLMLPARRRYYTQQCACLRMLLYDAIELNAPILTF